MTAKQRLIRALRDGRGSSNGSRDDGFTLVELVMAIAIMSIIMGVISASLFLVLHTVDSTSDQISATRYAQTLGVFLPSDVQTAGSINLVPGAATGCSVAFPGTNILTLASSDSTATVSYRAVVQSDTTYQLQRFNCLNGAASSMHLMAEGMPATTSATVSVIRSTLLNSGLKILTLTMNVSVVHGRSAPFTFAVSGYSRTPVPGVTSGLTLVSSANPSTKGGSVTFTATVTNAGTVPTGTVTFLDGANTLGSAVLDGTGTASFATTFNVIGSHNIVAQYGGDGIYNANSATMTQTVNKPVPVIVMSSSPNPSTVGQSVAFKATVTGIGVAPTGAVTISDGATVLAGTVTYSTAGSVLTATLNNSSLTAGVHASITASYVGDGNYSAGTSPVYSQTVSLNPTTTAISASSNWNSVVSGTSVVFTATVTPNSPTPTGTVTFYDGNVSLGVGTWQATPGQSKLTVALGYGAHSITATYSGDGRYAASTSTPVQNQPVTSRSSTISVAATSPAPQVGATAFITATVNGSGPGTTVYPTGSIAFVENGVTLATVALSQITNTLNASAVWAPINLSAGSHIITVQYGGDTNYTGSGPVSATQTIVKRSAITAITIDNPDPSLPGAQVTLAATVTGSGGFVPSNAVTFFDNTTSTTLAGTVSYTSVGNVLTATLLTNALVAPGSHSITANFAGDSTYSPSASAPTTHNVSRSWTFSSLTSSPITTTFGNSVTLTAKITGAAGFPPPGGGVTFYDGVTLLGSGTLSTSLNVLTATLSTTTLGGGNHANITAVYSGDPVYVGATSPALPSVLVSKATPTVSIASSHQPSLFGQLVTFTATVTGTANTAPAGPVTFTDNAVPLAGTVTYTSSGNVLTATLTTSAVAVGNRTVKASYNGDGNYLAGSNSRSQTVNAASACTLIPGSALISSNPIGVSGRRTQTVDIDVNFSLETTNCGSLTISVSGSGRAVPTLDSGSGPNLWSWTLAAGSVFAQGSGIRITVTNGSTTVYQWIVSTV